MPSWPAFVPITFELMVLCAAIGSAIVAIIAGEEHDSAAAADAREDRCDGRSVRAVDSATDPGSGRRRPSFVTSAVARRRFGTTVNVEGESHA